MPASREEGSEERGVRGTKLATKRRNYHDQGSGGGQKNITHRWSQCKDIRQEGNGQELPQQRRSDAPLHRFCVDTYVQLSLRTATPEMHHPCD